MAMDDEVPGAVGTSASFGLRMGQTIFSAASLLFMSLGRLLLQVQLMQNKTNKLRLREYIISNLNLALHNILILYLSPKKFCCCSFLVTIMGLVIPWSITLALIDLYSVLIHCPIRQPRILLFIVLGDWALAFLTLAAASSIAGIVDVLERADETFCADELCSRYQISAGLAFLSWFLSMASSLSNLWLLPSLTT